MKVTIKDIAKELNLNFSSVSRALNNKPGVSEETRKIVINTANKMGYRPNVIARGLVSNTTKTIGVIMPDILNPIFGEITTGIIETANGFNYDIFLCISNWSIKKEEDYINTIQQKQVDGLIIKSVNDTNSDLLKEANIPVVMYENWITTNRFSSVSTDNFKGGYIAAKHLLDCGYRNTALFIGPSNSSAGITRQKGFFSAYKEEGINLVESISYYGEYNIESGYNLAIKLFKENPKIDSIFTGNDVMALGVLQYLEEHNIIPGIDIGLIGFDNIKMAGLPQINLTTIKQPKYSIGRIMTKVLLDEISNKKEGIQNFPQRILLEPELIIRKTTCKR